jgi:hypothetical protein
MRLLQRLGQLAVDADIGGGEIAGLEQRDQMRFDRKSDLAPMGDLTGVPVSFLDSFEYAEQPEVEDLVEDLLLGIEVVVDAASLNVGDFGDLAQRGGRVSLAPKQLGRCYQNRIACFGDAGCFVFRSGTPATVRLERRFWDLETNGDRRAGFMSKRLMNAINDAVERFRQPLDR